MRRSLNVPRLKHFAPLAMNFVMCACSADLPSSTADSTSIVRTQVLKANSYRPSRIELSALTIETSTSGPSVQLDGSVSLKGYYRTESGTAIGGGPGSYVGTKIKFPSPKPPSDSVGGIVQIFLVTDSGPEFIGSVEADNSNAEFFDIAEGAPIQIVAYTRPGYKFVGHMGLPLTVQQQSSAFIEMRMPEGLIFRSVFEIAKSGPGGGGPPGPPPGNCPNPDLPCSP